MDLYNKQKVRQHLDPNQMIFNPLDLEQDKNRMTLIDL